MYKTIIQKLIAAMCDADHPHFLRTWVSLEQLEKYNEMLKSATVESDLST